MTQFTDSSHYIPFTPNVNIRRRNFMQYKVGTSRKEKAIQTKNKIYTSAEKLFNEKGFDAVNVDDIVKHAGVAKGSFYVHFESKDFLIATIIHDYVDKVDIDYKKYLKSFPSNMLVIDVILSLVSKIADVITENIGCENMSFLYKIQIAKDIKTNAVIDYNRELYKMFYDVISKGVNQQVFRSELNIEDMARHFVMAYRGLTFEWCLRYPEFDLKEQALCHFKILLNGIRRI